MAAWHRSNDRTGPLHLGSACGGEALDEISSGGVMSLDAPARAPASISGNDEILNFFYNDITELEQEQREQITFKSWLDEMISWGRFYEEENGDAQ
jgi:hypothetical protein